MRRFHELCQRRRDEHRADLIEAVAVARGGKPADMIHRLRNREP